MSEQSDIEVYRQRYETFRHLDRMRYQLLQILVALGAAIAIFFRFNPNPVEWWILILIGIMIFLIGNAMSKVSSGLWANNGVLSEIGKRIGDTNIPPPPVNRYLTASCWIYLFVQFLGGLFVLIGLFFFVRSVV